MNCDECGHKVKFAITYQHTKSNASKQNCVFCFNKLAPHIVKEFFREYITRGIEARLNIWR